MSFEYIGKIQTPEELKEAIPMPEDLQAMREGRVKELSGIFTGETKKFLLIIGPCSADNEKAVLDYVTRLRKLQDEVSEKLFIVPRIYTNKPRTTGEGYKGMGHQPDPMSEPDIMAGAVAIRNLHINVVKESGFVSADEMLYPGNFPYLDDVLGYVAVGARSVENQQHRLTASGLDLPVGMKNPTSGDMTVMLNAIKAAQVEHSFTYNGWEVKTSGNPLAHAILRGAVNQYGRNIPNYHFEDLQRLLTQYNEFGLKNPSIVIDCNHSNSGKKFNQQPRVAREVIHASDHCDDLKGVVKGLFVESYLVDGTQKPEEGTYGKSITDPCIGWEGTEALVRELADIL